MPPDMKLILIRTVFNAKSTFGELFVDGKYQCFVLEDTDRRLEAGGVKVYGKTAIPRGTYQIIVDRSQRFKRELPLLLDVPQFQGIRIHAGNKPEDTEGCLIPGLKIQPEKDWVANSRAAFDALFHKIRAAHLDKQKITIEVR